VGITEVLIALVIFSTAILGIVGTAAHVGGIVNASHVRLAVGTVARAQVEALMATPYDSIADGTAVDRGVQMGWTVTETGTVKDILFVYHYDLVNGAHHDTLNVACLKP
jgi:Tfp pilus assembly protein PilV